MQYVEISRKPNPFIAVLVEDDSLLDIMEHFKFDSMRTTIDRQGVLSDVEYSLLAPLSHISVRPGDYIYKDQFGLPTPFYGDREGLENEYVIAIVESDSIPEEE